MGFIGESGPKAENTVNFGQEKIIQNTQKLSGYLNSIEKSELDLDQKKRFEKIKEKIKNISFKFIKTIKWIALLASTIGVVNYELVHTKLDITNKPDGTREYRHKDARTTHLLNMLAGREKMTEEDLRIDYNAIVRETAKQMKYKLSKDPDKMTLDELDEAVFEISLKKGEDVEKGDFKKDFQKELARHNTVDTSTWHPNENIYELVWQLEQEAGNPKVRFNSEDLHFIPFSSPDGRLHYSAVKNTIFISSDDFTAHHGYAGASNLVAELSHGKQMNDHPISTALNEVADLSKVFVHGGFNLDKLTDEYHKLYSTPGSVEHEAHELIEPYLLKKYKLFYKK